MQLRAEQRLMQLAATTAERRGQLIDLVDSTLEEGVDWPQLAAMMRGRRLLSTLGPPILSLAGEKVAEEFREEVSTALASARRHGAIMSLVATRLTELLSESGVRSYPLKGPQLADELYGDPGRRLSSDLDLLVPIDQLHAAAAVATDMGYLKPDDYVDGEGLPQLHLTLLHGDAASPPVELHWRVHWYDRKFAQLRLLPDEPDPGGSWRPAPADALLALLLFYARDGFIDLRLATDIAAWWDARGNELSQSEFQATLIAFPQLTRAAASAAIAAERVVGLPARDLLPDGWRPRRRDRMAVALANPHPRSTSQQLYADMGLIDGLLTPSGGYRAFIKRQLILPPEVLDAQDKRVLKRRLRSVLGRNVRVLVRCAVIARYLLALVRIPWRRKEIAL